LASSAAGRRTLDIDFGIAVRDWEHFQALKSALAEQASFTVHRVHQRLIYPTPLAVIVDLIPFGGVEREDRTIAWPPDEDFVMRVAGFRDGLESSVPVRLAEELVVRVVSIPTLLLLKLFAWLDRTCVWAWACLAIMAGHGVLWTWAWRLLAPLCDVPPFCSWGRILQSREWDTSASSTRAKVRLPERCGYRVRSKL
jgi:hypothetical protein